MSKTPIDGLIQCVSYHERKLRTYRRWWDSNSSGLPAHIRAVMANSLDDMATELQLSKKDLQAAQDDGS